MKIMQRPLVGEEDMNRSPRAQVLEGERVWGSRGRGAKLGAKEPALGLLRSLEAGRSIWSPHRALGPACWSWCELNTPRTPKVAMVRQPTRFLP